MKKAGNFLVMFCLSTAAACTGTAAFSQDVSAGEMVRVFFDSAECDIPVETAQAGGSIGSFITDVCGSEILEGISGFTGSSGNSYSFDTHLSWITDDSIYAVYENPDEHEMCTIRYIDLNGTVLAVSNVARGGSIEDEIVYAPLEGAEFLGWSADGENKFDFSNVLADADVYPLLNEPSTTYRFTKESGDSKDLSDSTTQREDSTDKSDTATQGDIKENKDGISDQNKTEPDNKEATMIKSQNSDGVYNGKLLTTQPLVAQDKENSDIVENPDGSVSLLGSIDNDTVDMKAVDGEKPEMADPEKFPGFTVAPENSEIKAASEGELNENAQVNDGDMLYYPLESFQVSAKVLEPEVQEDAKMLSNIQSNAASKDAGISDEPQSYEEEVSGIELNKKEYEAYMQEEEMDKDEKGSSGISEESSASANDDANSDINAAVNVDGNVSENVELPQKEAESINPDVEAQDDTQKQEDTADGSKIKKQSLYEGTDINPAEDSESPVSSESIPHTQAMAAGEVIEPTEVKTEANEKLTTVSYSTGNTSGKVAVSSVLTGDSTNIRTWAISTVLTGAFIGWCFISEAVSKRKKRD